MSRPPVIGLIGFGRWGRLICRDLIDLGCPVEVVCSGPDAWRAALAAGATAVHADSDPLSHVEGIVVATPTSTHADVVERILPLGLPVFVEKPMTHRVADADRIATAAGNRVFVMDKWRYHPGVIELAAIARSGELGPVLGMQTRRVQWRHPHPDVDCVWILAPHDLSIFQEVVGSIPDPRAAVAEWGPEGLVGLSGILGTSPWLTIEVGARRDTYQRNVRLVCEGGYAELADGWDDSISVVSDSGGNDAVSIRRYVGEEMPLRAELSAFVGYLRGGPAPKSTAYDGLATVQAIARLHELAGSAPIM